MILNIKIVVIDSALAEVPMQEAPSLPQSAEPVDLGGDAEACSPPPPYSTLPVQNYSMGNGNLPYNFSQGQGSEHVRKQTPAAETNNQALPEEVLTEGKVQSYP